MDKVVGVGVSEKLWGEAEPLFAVADAKTETFGKFRDSGLPAFAAKKFPGHTAWFSAVPLLDWRSLRFIFERAGVHFFANEKTVVYAGNGTLTFHFKNGGMKTVTLRNGRKVTLQMPEGSATVVLDGESGSVLMGGK
jgi:hypothetical protein